MNGPDFAARASLAAVIEHDLDAIRRIEGAVMELDPDAGFSQCAGVAYGAFAAWLRRELSAEG